MALASAKAQPLTNGKLKLMICDDSNIIRRKIERELQIDRLQVVATAANGKQAVEAFRKAIALNTSFEHNDYQVTNAHFRLGQSLVKLGRTEEARAAAAGYEGDPSVPATYAHRMRAAGLLPVDEAILESLFGSPDGP